MHTKIPYQKTGGQRKERPAPARAGLMKPGVPNSAMLSMLSGGGQPGGMPIDELGERVMDRLPSVRQRPQAQIPRAENEADRLSSAVNAGTPESVKAVMGRRMGADFSGVRFHTGAAAAARADAMGARAYTSGADVYFGTGGFDAAVAAHELVHTAQQGMVSSGVETMSTPPGGVQMATAGGTGAAAARSKRERAKNWLKSGAEKAKEKTWDKTGGRLIRKHHDAMDELHEAQGGDWAALTPAEQASWKRHNPLAYYRYMHSGGAQSAADARLDTRAQELRKAEKYIADHKDDLKKHSTMLTTVPSSGPSPAGAPAGGDMVIGFNKADKGSFGNPVLSLGDAAETGAAVADEFVRTPVDLAQSVAETANAAEKGTSGAGAFGGALGIVTGAVGAASAAGDIHEAARRKHTMGIVDSSVDLTGNLAKTGSGASGIAKAALTAGSGAAEAAKDAVAGLDIVSGAADIYSGGRDIYKGENKREAMNAFQQKYYRLKDRENLADGERLLHDMSTLGKMEGKRQVTEGVGKALTGAMDVAAGGLELGGATAGAGLGVKAASAATKAGFAVADIRQRRRMKKAVVEQTTGLTDEKIRAFQKANGIKSFSRAKQALMKVVGYGSGQQEELFSDQTTKRGAALAAQANDPSAALHDEALDLAEGLGTVKQGGQFDSGRLAEAMGKRKSRGEIVSRKHRIKHMLSRRSSTTTP